MGKNPREQNKLTSLFQARGTSEPGPFGFIVGDPLVAGVKKLLPEARGYAVQVKAQSSIQIAFSQKSNILENILI
jgi:hypothetical protein